MGADDAALADVLQESRTVQFLFESLSSLERDTLSDCTRKSEGKEKSEPNHRVIMHLVAPDLG